METKKILVVDDEKGICENVRKILAKNNFEVTQALSAKEALEKMANESYSLLISDIVMPETNGLELLKLVKEQWPLTQVIMMTAYASTDTAMKAIRLGALDYVSKPFTPSEMRSTVEKAFSGELRETPASEKERKAIEVIDLDIPYERKEVVKYAGDGYADRLGPSDMAVVEMPSPETLEYYCGVGQKVCDIFRKLGNTCKAGLKGNACPQAKKAAGAKKSGAGVKEGADPRNLIGIDQPFLYEEVVSVTGPEYVMNLQGDGMAFVPYEELKERMKGVLAREKRTTDVDIPFDRGEVAAVTGPEYARLLQPGGFAPVPYEDLKEMFSSLRGMQGSPKAVVHEFPKNARQQDVLVIDDEVAVNNNIRKILSKKGFSVDQAMTKEEALRQIDANAYRLVLLDLRIPGVQGLELLQTIRQKSPESMIVMITGYASIETAKESARLGAVDYLAKPFTPDEVRRVAENAIRFAA